MVARTSRRRAALLAAPLLCLLLGGCSGSTGTKTATSSQPAPAAPTGTAPPNGATVSQPAICSDVHALQQSVANLQAVPLEAGALPRVQSITDQMKHQLTTLVADSKGQYEQQLAPVRVATVKLQEAVATVRRTPDTTTFSAVRSATSDLGAALQNLKMSLGNGC